MLAGIRLLADRRHSTPLTGCRSKRYLRFVDTAILRTMAERPRRRLAAIVAADVAGYSRLIGLDEEGTLKTLREVRRDIVSPLLSEHRGRVANTAGDSLLLEFSSVVDAVRCALAMQRAMAERNIDVPDERQLAFRVGINVGDVVSEDDDLLGDGVNVAARLEGLAAVGGIALSDDAYRQVRDRVDVSWGDAGEHGLKNIARPVRVWRWSAQQTETKPRTPAASGPRLALPDKPSIVVLPFDNLSRDPEQEYFSDGITEDIITDLSKVSGLFVIARNSAFVYKRKAVNVPDVCRELGVRFALEGSVRKAGNRVRITAQLIDGSRGGHLWAERYDRNLTDIFEVQDDVTQQIVAALQVTLSEAERSLIVDGGTKDVEAHELVLKGRALMWGRRRDREMFEQSMVCFRRAIELDANYAAAYAGLAMGYALDHQNHWTAAPRTSLDRAQRFVDEAIAKDDKDFFAHYVAAVVATWKKDYERWAYEADRTLSLNPNFALALANRGLLHIYTGEPAKAILHIERAMRLDPAAQHGQYLHYLGTAHLVAGDYETAATCFEDRITINPTTDFSRAFLAAALGHLGRADEARRIWCELKEINPRYSAAAHIGRLPFRDPTDAEKFIDGLRKASLIE
jgi:adenylate cyclase